MILRFLILLIPLSGCASSKAEWKVCEAKPMEEWAWHWCHESLDGLELHGKGVCRVSQLCKDRFILRDKVKRHQLFCAHGDMDCFRRYKILSKEIK